MKKLLLIRREEWLPALLVMVIMLALNALMIDYRYDLFTRGGKVAFWSLFTGHYMVSGFDNYIYLILSHWKPYYALYRHPLLAVFFYPLYLLNVWLMGEYEYNFAIWIVAALQVVCSFYTYIFLYRTLREVVGVGRGDSCLLSALFFSFAYVMLACFVPDHFGMSKMLIMLTVYLAGRKLRQGRPMTGWHTGLLFLLMSGLTLTNGLLPLLASLWTRGRSFFRWRHLAVAVVLPASLIVVGYVCVDRYVLQPDVIVQNANVREKLRKDKTFARRYAKQEARKAELGMSKNPYLQWIDTHTSRWDTAVENFFGESVQLHRDHLLQDTIVSRPVIVRYGAWYHYAAEALLVALFALGLWVGRRRRFMQMVMAWFAFNVLMHLVIGFALTEVYIMAVHWIWAIPIAVGYLLVASRRSRRIALTLRVAVAVLTLWLWAWNGTLIYMYMRGMAV